jgi:hypothetical protein
MQDEIKVNKTCFVMLKVSIFAALKNERDSVSGDELLDKRYTLIKRLDNTFIRY